MAKLRTTSSGKERRVVLGSGEHATKGDILATFATHDENVNNISAAAFRMGWAKAMQYVAKHVAESL